MAKHIEVLGWLYIIFGALNLVIGLGFFLFFAGLATLPHDVTGASALLLVGWAIGGLIVILSIPEIIGGVGLLRRQGWARILVLILGFLSLIEFPIGTAIGVYTIWVLLREESTRHFA